jgi:hypothetical protein
MARVAHCEFKEGGCDDGRCKIGVCILDVEEREKEHQRVIARHARIRTEAIRLLDDLFKTTRRRKATASEIEEYLANPKFWAVAEQRVEGEERLAQLPIRIDL